MTSTYLSHLSSYASWWRATAPGARFHHVHAELVAARARSIWYRQHALDASSAIPQGAPSISRQMLQAHPGAFLGDTDILHEGGYEGSTSGSTGEPVTLWMCPWSLAHYYMHIEEALALLPFELATQPRHLYLSISSSASSLDEPIPLWPGGRITRADVPDVAAAITLLHASRPHLLSLTPFELDLLLAANTPLPGSLQLVITTSAKLAPQTIDNFYTHVHDRSVHLLNSYGCSEIGPIAFQCPASRKASAPWHVPAGSALLESFEGFLAVTTLRNRAMPLTRYLVGDAVSGLTDVTTPHLCSACGHVGQSFERLQGRALQIVYTSRHAPRTTVGWLRVLNDPTFQITRHAIAQYVPGELLVTVSTASDPNTMTRLERALLGVDSEMHVTLVAH